MASEIPAEIPPSLPRTGSRFGRWVGRTLLRLGGWKLVGEVPDQPRLLLIVAPHSSYWDAVWGLAATLAVGARVGFLVKREMFTGPLGWLLQRLGAIPIDRSKPGRIVVDLARRFRESDRMWLGVAPEGTRKAVTQWKTGFWRIAKAAQVPVLCVYLHYPEKTIGLGKLFELGDDPEADIAQMRAYYAPFQGKYRGV